MLIPRSGCCRRTPPLLAAAILILGVTAFAPSGVRAETVRVGWFSQSLPVTSSADTLVELPSRVLVRDSISVRVDSLPLIAGYDFSVDYPNHTIRLSRSWPVGSTIHVEYRALPVDWPLVQQWMAPSAPPGDSSDMRPTDTFITSRADQADQSSGNLRIGGTKTFAIQVGSNRDLSLEQSLRVSVNGTVGEDVYVTAELSDQNLPIQPEGTTEDIREIDKVLVQVESPHYKAILGSYDFSYRKGEFGSYNRRLEGAQGQVSYDWFSVSGGVASARGEYRSYQLPLIDGTQGPYQLVDDVGNPGVVVIAGSERVWLDGQLLRRGETNDYVMDYSAGDIEFTRSRIITNDMRIVVDYEFASEDYARSSAVASAEIRDPGGRWEAALFLAQESDNADDPLAITLDDAALALVRQAGDDALQAAVPGWSTSEEGAYCAVDLGEAHFVYVGDEPGGCTELYNVSFSLVTPGEGTYTRTDGFFDSYYVYVGPGEGNYVPYVLYPLPERTRVVSLWGRGTTLAGVEVEAEVAMSDHDQNTLSSADDGDNRTYAGRIEVSSPEVELGGAGTVTVSGTARSVEDGFTALSRTTSAENNRKWGLPLSANRGQERTAEVTTVYRPATDHVLTLDAGVFERDTTESQTAYSAMRSGAVWRSTPRSGPEISANAEYIGSQTTETGGDQVDGAAYRGRGSVRHTIGYVRPGVGVEGEYEEAERSGVRIEGARYGEWTAELASAGIEVVGLSASLDRRIDQAWDTTLTRWEDEQRALTHTWQGAVRDWRGLSSTAEYSWRRRTGTDVDGEVISDVADVSVNYDPWDGLMRHDVRYRVSSTRTAERERVYVYVGEGQGDYRPLDPDEDAQYLSDAEVEPVAVGDVDGSYVLRYATTDTYRPSVSLDASYRLNLGLDRAWKGAPNPRSNERRPLWQRVLRQLRTETQLQVSEVDTARTAELYSVQFWTFRKPGESPTLQGRWSLLQDVTVWPNARRGDVRFRVRTSEDYDATLLSTNGVPSITKGDEYSVRTRLRFVEINTDWTNEISHERESSSGSSFDYRARRWLLDQTWAWHPTFQTEFALSNEIGTGWDPNPDADLAADNDAALRAYLISLEPTYRRAWGNRGMLRLALQWSGVYSRNLAPGESLPVQLLDGRDEGNNFRWTTVMNYRLSSLVTASLTYTGKKAPGSETVHTARMEMRAVF